MSDGNDLRAFLRMVGIGIIYLFTTLKVTDVNEGTSDDDNDQTHKNSFQDQGTHEFETNKIEIIEETVEQKHIREAIKN